MKQFNHEKVSKIAIDTIKHQQLMVYYDEDYEEVKALLMEMGFELKPLSHHEKQRRIIYINTQDKFAFVASALGMMCGATSGAQVIDYERLVTLVDET